MNDNKPEKTLFGTVWTGRQLVITRLTALESQRLIHPIVFLINCWQAASFAQLTHPSKRLTPAILQWHLPLAKSTRCLFQSSLPNEEPQSLTVKVQYGHALKGLWTVCTVLLILHRNIFLSVHPSAVLFPILIECIVLRSTTPSAPQASLSFSNRQTMSLLLFTAHKYHRCVFG